MLVLSIQENDIEENLRKAVRYRDMFDLVEVRVKECSPHYTLPESLPLCLTITDESALEGWSWNVSPKIVDLPFESSLDSLEKVREFFPEAIVQGSSHFEEERNLEALAYATLKKGFDAVKIVRQTSSLMEVFSLLDFLRNYRSEIRLTCFPMGQNVQYGRIIAAALGSFCSFCSLPSQPVSEGQIDIEIFHELYGGKAISKKTALYGLIGGFVDKSLSHATHTKLFRAFGFDGVYVKIPVELSEAKEALKMFSLLGFQGLSVTTPLKQLWGKSFVNTVRWEKEKESVLNTDGKALFDAMKARGSFKSVLILGAGAVAQTCAKELTEVGVQLFFHNRTRDGAVKLAVAYDGEVVDLETLQHVDVVVNATSFSDLCLPLQKWGVELVCEYVYPEKSALLISAEKLKIPVVTGTELWIRQAAKQFHFWCGFDEDRVMKHLHGEVACTM